MKYVRGTLTPRQGYFDPGERALQESGVRLEAIHDIDVNNDGTLITQYELSGPVESMERVLESHDGTVIDFRLSTGAETHFLQVHYHPCDLVRDLFDVHYSSAVVLSYPLEYVGQSPVSLRVAEVGPADAIREVVASTRELVDLTIDEIGTYDPLAGELYSLLTERQRQVLQLAVEMGYYELPREVTYEELGAELDCSPSAVGDHLRRIERLLVRSAIPNWDRLGPTPDE